MMKASEIKILDKTNKKFENKLKSNVFFMMFKFVSLC